MRGGNQKKKRVRCCHWCVYFSISERERERTNKYHENIITVSNKINRVTAKLFVFCFISIILQSCFWFICPHSFKPFVHCYKQLSEYPSEKGSAILFRFKMTDLLCQKIVLNEIHLEKIKQIFMMALYNPFFWQWKHIFKTPFHVTGTILI